MLRFEDALRGLAQSLPQAINAWYEYNLKSWEMSLKEKETGAYVKAQESQAGYYTALQDEKRAMIPALVATEEARALDLTVTTRLNEQKSDWFDREQQSIIAERTASIENAKALGTAALINAKTDAARLALSKNELDLQVLGYRSDLENAIYPLLTQENAQKGQQVIDQLENRLGRLPTNMEAFNALAESGMQLNVTPQEFQAIQSVQGLTSELTVMYQNNIVEPQVQEQMSTWRQGGVTGELVNLPDGTQRKATIGDIPILGQQMRDQMMGGMDSWVSTSTRAMVSQSKDLGEYAKTGKWPVVEEPEKPVVPKKEEGKIGKAFKEGGIKPALGQVMTDIGRTRASGSLGLVEMFGSFIGGTEYGKTVRADYGNMIYPQYSDLYMSNSDSTGVR